jgi:hypothetical protein
MTTTDYTALIYKLAMVGNGEMASNANIVKACLEAATALRELQAKLAAELAYSDQERGEREARGMEIDRLQAKLELADKELDHKMRLQISFEEEIDDLKDRLSEAERDARRYRWLRDDLVGNGIESYDIAAVAFRGTAEKFDARIDAALAAKGQ